jgi:hypothetical protein
MEEAIHLTQKIWTVAKNYTAKERKVIYLSEEVMSRASNMYLANGHIYSSSYVCGMAAAYTKEKPRITKLTKKALGECVEELHTFDREGIDDIVRSIRGEQHGA